MKHVAEKVAPQLSNRYLRTSRLLTIRHLCKFLAKKLGESDYKVYRIYLPNQSLPLSEDLTLDVIDREVCFFICLKILIQFLDMEKATRGIGVVVSNGVNMQLLYKNVKFK